MKLPIKQAVLFIAPFAVCAGPYAPPAGQPGSTAVSKDDPEIRHWANEVVDYKPGDALDDAWKDTSQALGPAEGDINSVVSLGRGGSIVLAFPEGISNGPGWDLVIFENAFDDFFLELAVVAPFSRLANQLIDTPLTPFTPISLTASPIPAFGQVDATNIHNLAGKYRAGYGTPFDLDDFSDRHQNVDKANVKIIILIDVVGDGSLEPSEANIYDPYPTIGSAGFDLDAVGVRYPRAFDSVKIPESSWSYSEVFGSYVGVSFPWTYFETQGWWHVTGNEREGLWIWDAALGWLWTSAAAYPSLYSSEREGWLYYGGTEGSTRFFNDLAAGEWFDVPIN